MAEKNNSSSLAEKASAVPLGGQESARRWRTRWLVGVVIGALLVACGVFYEADEHDGFAQLYADVLHGGVRGPYGAFPTSPPVRPSLKSLRTVVGTVSVSSLVYGGISISSTSDNVVVNAVDIRSGKTYWRYRRHHLENSSTALDKKRGELFAAWGPPWPASGKTSIEMMDVRSGRVRWRRSTGLTSVWSAKGPKSGFTRMAVDDAGRMVVLGDRGMAGLDSGTGRVRWTTLWPPGCLSLENPVMVAGTAAFELTCQNTATTVGYDTATGAQRWHLDFDKLIPKNPDYESLKGGASTRFSDLGDGLMAIWTDTVTVVTDPTSGRIIRHLNSSGYDRGSPAEGIQVGECRLPGPVWRLCANDLRTGRALWRTKLPLDHPDSDDAEFTAAIDHDRVYTLSADPAASWQVSVFDLHTGTMLEQAPMPTPPRFSTPQSYELVKAADGVLTIRIAATPFGKTAFSLVA